MLITQHGLRPALWIRRSQCIIYRVRVKYIKKNQLMVTYTVDTDYSHSSVLLFKNGMHVCSVLRTGVFYNFKSYKVMPELCVWLEF